jgi:6-phosphogluconolactonase
MTVSPLFLWLGRYTTSDNLGLSRCTLVNDTGQFEQTYSCTEIQNPSYICTSSSNTYCVSELSKHDAASLHRLDESGNEQQTVPLGGDYPCHVSLSHNKRWLAIAHYGTATFEIFSVQPSGEIGVRAFYWQNVGSSVNQSRQEAAHGHQIVFAPENTVVTVDLGIDALHFYTLDDTGDTPALDLQQTLEMPLGSGPRHVVFTHNGLKGYVVCELTEQLCVIEKTLEGYWQVIHVLDAFPEHEENGQAAGAIKLSPDEKFVYLSGRAQSVISWFDITSSQTPQYRGYVSSGGDFPRDFEITPDGQWMVISNQHSHNVVSLKMNLLTGQPGEQRGQLELNQPVCVVCH